MGKTKNKLCKLISLTIVFSLLTLTLAGCGEIKIPNLYNVNEETAKTMLFDEGFIVSSKYEYSDAVKEGCVMYSVPSFGESVPKGSNIIIYVSKGEELKVPDLSNVDEESAKQMLSNSGLIVNVEYEYNEVIEERMVVSTSPASGEAYEENDNITIYVSKGPMFYSAETANISWESIDGSYEHDDYEFERPYVSEGILYIPIQVMYNCYYFGSPKFEGFGTASLSSDYIKTVPITVDYYSEIAQLGEWENIELQIPLSSLGDTHPTNLYVKYYVELFSAQEGDFQDEIELSFNITW